MRQYTGDPHADYAAHEREQEAWLDKLPRCSECGEPIQDEYAFLINDIWICESCLDREYKKSIDDYID